MTAGWHASLELAYAADGDRTIPVVRRHSGPLRVQKGFTPEGPQWWHQLIVHPPGGIANGDRLAISVKAEAGARVLLTSPGAAKWYRCDQGGAEQTVDIEVAADASVEWLPLESIFFDGAQARLRSRYRLHDSASLIAADLYCLGRPAAGESFDHGTLRTGIEVHIGDQLAYSERALITGGDRALAAPAGLGERPLFGTLIAVSARLDDDALQACRAVEVAGEIGITRLDRILLARWRGARSDEGLHALRAVWAALRPKLLGRIACPPRIWST